MKRVFLISLSIIGMAFLIFYYGFQVNEKRYSEFENGGYIISKVKNITLVVVQNINKIIQIKLSLKM